MSESHLPGPTHQTQINLSNQHTTRQYIEPYNATVVHTVVPQRVASTSIPTVSRVRGIGGGGDGVSVSNAGTSNDFPMQTEDEKAREDQIRRELELVVEMVESYARMYVRETHRALLGSDPSVPPLTNAPLFPSPIVSGVTVPAAAAGGMPAGGGGGVAGPTSLAAGIHAILSHPSYLPSAIPTVEPLWQLMNKCQIGGASGGGPIAAKRRHDTTTAIATIVNSTNLGTGGIANDGVVKRESNAQVGTTNVVSGVSVRNPNHRSVNNNTNVLTSVKRLKVSEQDYIASSKRSNNNTLAAAVDGGDDDDGANSPSPSASPSSSSSSSATSSDDDGDEEYAPRGGGGCAGRRRTRAGVNRRGKMTPKKATKTKKTTPTKVTSRTLNNGRTTKAGRTVKMKVIEDSTIDGEEEEDDDEYGDGVGSDEDQDDAANIDDDDEYDFDPNDDPYRSVGGGGGGGSGHRVSKSSTSGGGGGGGGGGHSGSSRQRRSKLPLKSILTLRTFFVMHIDHPFPKDVEKRELAEECNLNFKQVSDWFTNTRKVREPNTAQGDFR